MSENTNQGMTETPQPQQPQQPQQDMSEYDNRISHLNAQLESQQSTIDELNERMSNQPVITYPSQPKSNDERWNDNPEMQEIKDWIAKDIYSTLDQKRQDADNKIAEQQAEMTKIEKARASKAMSEFDVLEKAGKIPALPADAGTDHEGYKVRTEIIERAKEFRTASGELPDLSVVYDKVMNNKRQPVGARAPIGGGSNATKMGASEKTNGYNPKESIEDAEARWFPEIHGG